MTLSGFASLLMAALAWLTLHPFKPASVAGVAVQWLCRWLVQNFAPYWLLATVALLCALAAQEPASHPVTIVLSLLALVGFAMVYQRGHATKTDVQSQVTATLNALNALRAEDEPGASGGPKKGRLARLGLRPFHFGKANVSKIADINYGDGSKHHLLDIYLPRQAPSKPMPVLIQVPGGAWITGSKDQQALPLLHRMAALGWCCFSINYRLGPRARFPDMLVDVLSAVAWVKSHAHEYGGNPEFIVLTGGSAGGHLATLAALEGDNPRFKPGFESSDTRVNLVVPFYGRYDFLNRDGLLPGDGLMPFLTNKVMPCSFEDCPDLWHSASPLSRINDRAPPFFIVHGSEDSMIPVEEARAFARALGDASKNPVDFLEVPGAEHAFDMVCSSWCLPTLEGVVDVMNAYYNAHKGNQPPR